MRPLGFMTTLASRTPEAYPSLHLFLKCIFKRMPTKMLSHPGKAQTQCTIVVQMVRNNSEDAGVTDPNRSSGEKTASRKTKGYLSEIFCNHTIEDFLQKQLVKDKFLLVPNHQSLTCWRQQIGRISAVGRHSMQHHIVRSTQERQIHALEQSTFLGQLSISPQPIVGPLFDAITPSTPHAKRI